MIQKINRSAKTGEFVSKKFAKKHKATTVSETISPRMEKKMVTVKVTKSNGWYKKGEVHKVLPTVSWFYLGEQPHWEKQKHQNGISVFNCKPINPRIKKM